MYLECATTVRTTLAVSLAVGGVGSGGFAEASSFGSSVESERSEWTPIRAAPIRADTESHTGRAAKRRTRPQMLAACVQTDSKNEKRARKRYLGVSTLVPLKRKSATKCYLAVNCLTTVWGRCVPRRRRRDAVSFSPQGAS